MFPRTWNDDLPVVDENMGSRQNSIETPLNADASPAVTSIDPLGLVDASK